MSSAGEPLDATARKFMQSRFGHDFSRVRVHTDAAAAQSAKSVNAYAYTVGHHVVFGDGQYRPGTLEGRQLIAHELTHVVQQAREGTAQLDRKSLDEAEQSLREVEAKRSAKVKIGTRASWGAAAPDKSKGWDEYDAGKPLPLYRIIVHHTADPLKQTVKELQDKEMKAGYADMPYHFVITSDGAISEGRAIEVVGAHAGDIPGNKDIKKDPDWGSIGIVLTGDFESRKENLWSPDKPTSAQLSSLKTLTERLMQKYSIPATSIFKHSEVRPSPTACPGKNLAPEVERIRKELTTQAKETGDAFKDYFKGIQVFPMNDLLKRIAAFGNLAAIEWLLSKYDGSLGRRPEIAMRAVIMHLKGAAVTQAERDALLADSAKEFPDEKKDQHEAIAKLVGLADFFATIQSLAMPALLAKIKAVGKLSAVEQLLADYEPFVKNFGRRPQIAIRAVIIHLKGTAATEEERDKLIADSASEFAGKEDQHKAILKLIGQPAGVKKSSLEPIAVHDAEEQEAEAVAVRIARSAESELVAAVSGGRQQGSPQRFSPQLRPVGPAAPSFADSPAWKSEARPLPVTARSLMEGQFGFDFSSVRIHTGPRAAESARGMSALAFTVGQDVVFGEGRFMPETNAGRRLLAHELTHTIQQSHAGWNDQGHLRPVKPGRFPTSLVMRTPAPPADRTIDHSKLKITTELNSLDFYEFLRLAQPLTVEYFTATTNVTSTWSLYDANDNLVDQSEMLGGARYMLLPNALKSHVQKMGTGVFGKWTLRYEKDAYYDDKIFTVGSAKPAQGISEATTTASLYSLHSLPGRERNTVIGDLPGIGVPVSVNDKAEVAGEIWYQVTLKAPIKLDAQKKELPIGTQAWVIGSGKNGEMGVVATVTWDAFIKQLRKFEQENSSLSLDKRITKLRQWSHEDNLPFDSIIGTDSGNQYLNNRGFIKNEWQLLKDSQIVHMPDGKRVDVYHLMVGLDVLPRKVEEQTYFKLPLGQNYSAALWAGDIGAGAADAYLGHDDKWEGTFKIPTPKDPKRKEKLNDVIERYYSTRAPDSDLLGDIDAWGINALRENKSLSSIEGLLTEYYTKTSTKSDTGETVTNKRKEAIENFLRAYKFNTDSPLATQTDVTSKLAQQIYLFAVFWIRRQKYSKLFTTDFPNLLSWYVIPMTIRFAKWLEKLAEANGAEVSVKPKTEKAAAGAGKK
ncbi:MAG TPA: DUF4157 domain-containing protein [Pyrinomonadaceae bacterium]|nr:DUF4157 domain-containing protein [Pyrinomonadaceae bacterium]